MASMDRFAPKDTGVRDPRSSGKKNGMFWNVVRYVYFGGAPGAPMQAGSKGPNLRAGDGQNAAAPISDRGKGRR